MVGTVRPGAQGLGEILEIVSTLVLVTAGTAVLLRGLDAVPGWMGHDRRGVQPVDSVDAAARLFGGPVVLPAFFPDTIAWPPARIWVRTRPPRAVVLVFTGRAGGSERLRLCQVRGTDVPAECLPHARVLHRVTPDEAGLEAGVSLERVQRVDGTLAHDLVWHQGPETVALRYGGSADELVAIARSLRWRRP